MLRVILNQYIVRDTVGRCAQRSAGILPAKAAGTVAHCWLRFVLEWRNWQTHETQNLALLSSVGVQLPPPAVASPSPFISAKARAAVSTVWSMSASVWALETNAASNCDGGK